VERLLAGPNGRQPLVLDDLHWADPATLDLLEHLVARQAPVTLLGTWRMEDPLVPSHVRGWWERMRRLPATTTLALDPLDRTGTVEQIEQLGVATPGLADRVFARSGGRPLFTEQLAVHGGDDLPELLGDLLNRRLGELGPDAELVATWLGVADRPLLRGRPRDTERPRRRADVLGAARARKPLPAGHPCNRRGPSPPAPGRGGPPPAAPPRATGRAPGGRRAAGQHRMSRCRGRRALARRAMLNRSWSGVNGPREQPRRGARQARP
jgi:hypothetical protein